MAEKLGPQRTLTSPARLCRALGALLAEARIDVEKDPPRGATQDFLIIDWEMAAIGPGLIDLAALVSGGWSAADRTAVALSYRDAATTGQQMASRGEFLQALGYCRRHLAVQWLGWSPEFSPPPEHQQDWLREALELAAQLGM